MFRKLLFLLIVILTACKSDSTSLSNHKTFSSDKSAIKAYNLISPQTANNWITDHPDQYIPIQVSKKASFVAEHIPNAQNIWRPDYASHITEPYSGLIPSKEKLQNLLQNLGYEKGKVLLLYDIKANVDAMRFAWVLNLYGFDNFKIINGGFKYWKILNLPTTNQQTSCCNKTDYQLTNTFDDSIIANFKDVYAAITDTNTILIDTREAYEFYGNPFISKDKVIPFKKGAFARGSIPNSVHLNWSTLADLGGDHRIKSEKDLRFDLAQKGITPEKNIILYCQSGSRTSHTFYVLKHVLGYERVKNYDGSWIEWSYKYAENNNDTPIQQLTSQQAFETKKDSLLKRLN